MNLKKIAIFTLMSSCVFINGCATTQGNSSNKKAPKLATIAAPKNNSALPSDQQVRESVTLKLVKTENLAVQETVPLLLAGVGLDLAVVAGKALTAQLASAMKNYADKYGATYSAKAIQDDFDQTNPGVVNRLFLFRRTMVSKSKDSLLKLLPNPKEGTLRYEDGVWNLDVVRVPFVLSASSGTSGKAIRIKPAQPSDFGKHDEFKPVYQGLKGLALGASSIDKLNVAFTVSLHSASGSYMGFSEGTWTLASSTIEGGDLLTLKDVALAGDWNPAPAGAAYSVSISITETSKMKEWVTKAADNLKTAADSGIDSWRKSKD